MTAKILVNNRMWKKWKKWSWKITQLQLEKLLMLAYHLAHAMKFFHLGVKCTAAKFVLKVLNLKQKKWWMEVTQESLNEVNNDVELLKRVITGDGNMGLYYNVEIKAQLSHWRHSGSPWPKKVRQVRSNVRIMFTVFFDFSGVVHHEYLTWLNLCAIWLGMTSAIHMICAIHETSHPYMVAIRTWEVLCKICVILYLIYPKFFNNLEDSQNLHEIFSKMS